MDALTSEGVLVSEGGLVSQKFLEELHVHVCAIISLLRLPESSGAEWDDALNAFESEFVHALTPATPVMDSRTSSAFFRLALHGILKHGGAGGVCCLAKTEPGVRAFAARVMAEGWEEDDMRSSWDSVNYLPPSFVDENTPRWIHKDARLSVTRYDGTQLLFNLRDVPQDGPAGDAAFVCVPGSHADVFTESGLVAQGLDATAVSQRFRNDFVMLSAMSKDGADPTQSPLWKPGRTLRRTVLPALGGVAWDSRIIHCGSLFSKPGRPFARAVKYVHFFRASQHKMAANKTHQLLKLMIGDATQHLSALPIAVTTPHRGNRKNSDGHFPTFRVAGEQLRIVSRLNAALDDPRVRPFFTLPHQLARAIRLLGNDRPLGEITRSVRTFLGDGPSPPDALSEEDKARLCLLRKFHAPLEESRKRQRFREFFRKTSPAATK